MPEKIKKEREAKETLAAKEREANKLFEANLLLEAKEREKAASSKDSTLLQASRSQSRAITAVVAKLEKAQRLATKTSDVLTAHIAHGGVHAAQATVTPTLPMLTPGPEGPVPPRHADWGT